MFQSVINQPSLSAGRFGAGVWVSLMLHAGVFAGVLCLSGQAVKTLENREYEIGPFRNFTPPPRRGDPAPHPTLNLAQPSRPKSRSKPRTELVQPTHIPPPPPLDETPKADEPPPSGDTSPSVSNTASTSDGPFTGGTGGEGPEGPSPTDSILETGTREEVLPFGSGMTPPALLSPGSSIRYTREAVEANVSGLVTARCTITLDGSVQDCHIIKGLPYMDAAVLEALETRHYRPVTFQGRNVSVSYTFHVKLGLR